MYPSNASHSPLLLCSPLQIEKGMFISRKVQFAGMLLKVSDLWAQGDRVMSGVVIDSSRVGGCSAFHRALAFICLHFCIF